MINNNSKTVTVEDIQNEYPTLGIPHFQRGLVWNDDSVLRFYSLYMRIYHVVALFFGNVTIKVMVKSYRFGARNQIPHR